MKLTTFVTATLALILALPRVLLTNAVAVSGHRHGSASSSLGSGTDVIAGGSVGWCGVPGASCIEKTTVAGGSKVDGGEESELAGTTLPVGAVSTSPVGAISPQFDYAMGNLSYLFGWQMAGSALSNDQLDVTCNNIAATGHYKWVAESLIPANIREPICNVSDMSLSPARAVPHIVNYNTGLFITQVLHAFSPHDTTSLNFLCELMPFIKLNNIQINTQQVLEAICFAAGVVPSSPMAKVTEAAIGISAPAEAQYANMASLLYGNIYASASVNTLQLNVNCAHAPESTAAFNAMMLNGTAVVGAICGIAAPMSVGAGVLAIKNYSSSMFLTVVEALGPRDASYLVWLCKALNVAAMDGVGMDGAAVRAQVCSDSV